MSKEPETRSNKEPPALGKQVGAKAARKLKARRKSTPGIWFGLGMMGVVGWSVVVPTLLGTALGIWIDNRYPGKYSWTLMLLLIGLIIGCLTAWFWVAKEDKEIRHDQEDNDA
jgi:ATP synthase protein I